MNSASPRRKRRYQSGYQGAMPSDCQCNTSKTTGDGGKQEHSELDIDNITDTRPSKLPKVSGTFDSQHITTGQFSDALEKCHRFSVLVTDSDYFKKTDQITAESTGNATRKAQPKPERVELRFYCKLKDLWSDKYVRIGPKRRRRHRKVTTGDLRTDKLLTNLELQGYGMIEVLTTGRFSSTLVSYSQIHKKNVTLKLSRINARRTDVRACDFLDDMRSWDDASCSAEMFFYTRLKHKNIVNMFEYYVINGYVILSLEFCENGNLKQLVRHLSGNFLTEPIAYRYFTQMLDALSFLHGSFIVHRDIASEHFLIDNYNNVKLCDFSQAEEYRPGDALFSDRCGTDGYIAPEVIELRPMYNPVLVDIWALGVVLFEITTGRLPFTDVKPTDSYSNTERNLILNEMSDSVVFSVASSALCLSQDIVDLFKGIFQRNTRDRFTLKRIVYSEWCRKKTTSKLQIGNFYKVQQPQKITDSRRESSLKKQYEI